MSLSLFYKPVIETKKVGNQQLHDIIEKKLIGLPKMVGIEFISYLEALRDANVDGSDELIKAINSYGYIELSEGQ
jgi:hypothetical protein